MIWLALACREDPPPTSSTPDSETSPSSPFVAAPGSIVLPGVYVLDALGARGPVSVVVTGESIAAVLDGAVVPENADPLDVGGAWVVPGLVDPHVHLFLGCAGTWVGDPLPHSLRATIAHGVTTAVDTGSPLVARAVQARIRAGDLLGPDLYVLGPMVTALGSHPCEVVYEPEWCSFVTDEADAEAAAIDRAEGDGIKLALADASFTPWPTPRLSEDLATTATSIVGGWVVAHVDEDEDVQIALAAGADQLAHPVFGGPISAETVNELLARDVAVHTTLGPFAGIGELLDGTLPVDVAGDERVNAAWAWVQAHPESVDPAWIAGSAAWLAQAETSLLALDAAGVQWMPASDAGYPYVPHGLGLHLELQRLAALGFDPQALIVAATAGNAARLGLSDRGTVAVGQRADLLVVTGDPRDDLTRLELPGWVVLAGVPRADLANTDVLVTRAGAALGEFCLDERDCTTGACDLVRHACAEFCAQAGDPAESCGPGTWCTPADAVDFAPACREVRTCELLDPTSCAPAPYAERCAPLDRDTNGCFPAGPRAEGENCDPIVTAATCQPGLVCTLDDLRCHPPCAGIADCDPGEECVPVLLSGEPWFGTCR